MHHRFICLGLVPFPRQLDTGTYYEITFSRQLLPTVVASEVEQVAADAIHTAFRPTTPGFKGK